MSKRSSQGDWKNDSHNKRSLKGASIRDISRRRARRIAAQAYRHLQGQTQRGRG